MMAIANYINELLYRYDCVIVPNFGGFITNKISAQIHESSHTFSPPSKRVGFNPHLTHNDGLLANYIASSEGITFDQANIKINEIVSLWNSTIKKETLKIINVGAFSLNNKNKLIFNPSENINYLKYSFGLTSIKSSLIEINT